SILQARKRFNDSVTQRGKEFGKALLERFENVAREFTVMRALFENDEVVDLAEEFPGFGKLRGDQLSKERSDTDVRKIIATSPDFCPTTRVITVLGMINRLLHKPGKRLRALSLDLAANKFD